MINVVELSEFLNKQIKKRQIPDFILVKLQDWVEDVENRGLEIVRRIPGYHDEPLKGKLAGVRSIRLGKGWRAYYQVKESERIVVWVERIDKHEYGK
jgi:proteic killer suppression protein